MFRLLALICTCVYVARGQAARNLASDTCQADQNSVVIEPNAAAMLVGLLDMRGTVSHGVGCGQPDEVMMPAYEAMKWTLSRLNRDNGQIDGVTVSDSYVPGVKIGMTVYDTCANSKVATEKVISSFENFYVPKKYCTRPEDKLALGVIGASRSIVSQELAQWLKHLKGPMVSFSSSSVSLGDPSKYPYFMRTIPANSVQAQVIVELLQKLAWKKVSIVYSDDEATEEDYQQVLRLANQHDICITQALAAQRHMTTSAQNRILTKLKETDTHGVVYLGFREEAYQILSQITTAGAENLQWIFAGSISPDNDFVQKHGTRLRGFVAVSPDSRLSTEFRDYWANIDVRNAPADNPWLQEWFMTVHDCKLPGINYEPYASKTSCPTSTLSQTNYVQNQYVQAAIDAVMTYASALKSAHRNKCGGQRGVCASLKSMTTEEFYNDYMLKVQLTYTNTERIRSWSQGQGKVLKFDPSGEIDSPTYSIWNYNNRAGTYTVVKVGDYSNRQLNIQLGSTDMYNDQRTTVLNNLPTYPCAASGCGICLTYATVEKYIEIDGEVMINGMLPVHKPNGERCGGINAAGAQQAQAFIYAIQNVKTTLNILNNVDLGAIGFDDCGVGGRATNFIQQFESGVLDLKSGAGSPYTSNDVPVYVGALSDDVSLHAADLLTRLKIPQISYGATTTDLSNLKRYPYFMRAIPSMNKQVNAIVQILKEMDWTYVQVVNSPTTHGRTGSRDFIREAAANDICVTAAYELDTAANNAADIVNKLETRVEAKVVVVIGEPEGYNQLLKAIQTANEAGNLLLVGDVNWGRNDKVIDGAENAARGSITLDLTDNTLTTFRTYLAGLDVRSYSTNPWFKSWYEASYGCYLSADAMPMYTNACDPTKPITDAPGFKIDSHVLSVINSVYLSAMGIHKSLEKVCGIGYQTVCNNFKNAQNRADMVVAEMEKASFADATSKTFQLERREVNANFDIYNYRTGGYQRIGTFNTAGSSLQLNKNQIQYHSTPITSVCTGRPTCNICLQKLNKVLFIPGDVYLAGLFRVHEMGDSVYTCGNVRKHHGFLYSEVFAYAIDKVNSGTGPVKLNGVTLGGVGLDDCSSSFQASNIISGIYSGSMPIGKDGVQVQSDMIIAWLSYGNEETLSAAEELSKRELPLISPSATSTALSDIATFPTFFRTVPNDFLLTQSMVRLFLDLKWDCVQIVYSPNSYGRSGYRTFRQNAKAEKLCVTQCLELETDGTYDEIIAKLADSPSKAVVVIAEADQYVPHLLEAKRKANNNNIVFIGTSSWGKSKNIVKGHEIQADRTLTLSVDNPAVPDFDNYLRSKFPGQYTRNPWMEQYYQSLFACDLPGNNKYGQPCNNPGGTGIPLSPNYEQESWVVPTLDAVYAAAQAIDLTLKDICGENYNGMCPQFVSQDVSQAIIANLGKVSFVSTRGQTFTFNSRSGGVGYDIHSYRQSQYNKVGTTVGLAPDLNDRAALTSLYNPVPTICTPCVECPLDVKNTEEQFIYLPGDILLGGMFDVHKRGLFPFTCDTIRPEYSFQLTEAFAYAIEQVNSKQGLFSDKLRGITLGGVGLDSCESAIRAGNLIADFHSGVIQLTKNGETVDPDKVKAYIGGMSTERTMQMADVLNELKLPQISYGAAGMALHDRHKYPLFSRTIPANKKQVAGIIEFLKLYEINSVQVINSPGRYGENGAEEFIKQSIKEEICVSQNITFPDNGTVTFYSAAEVVNLLLNRPNSTVVVAFMDTDYINLFLKTVHNNERARGKFRFVGSEAWGKNTRVYRGAETDVRNAATFNVDTGNVPGFNDYLASKFPNTYIRNPWLPAYFQEVYQCTLPGSKLQYLKPCSVIDRSIVNQDYEQESYVMYVVDAVYTAAIGLDQTLRDICGQNYTGICDEWRSDMQPSKHLLQGIRGAKFMDPAIGKEFKFVDDGESIRGFEIYSLEKYPVPGAILEYNLVGRYQHITDTDLQLSVAPSYRFNYYSSCKSENSCHMCPHMRMERSRYMQKAASEHINMVAFFGVHGIGKNYLTCGDMEISGGLLNNLAFFYGLELVNSDRYNNLHDKVKIGGLAIDTCSSINRMRSELYSYLRDDGLCLAARHQDLFHPTTVAAYLTGDSHSSMVAASMLTPKEKISLSQSMLYPVETKAHYPYLLRTLPNCGRQGEAVFKILEQNAWSFFMVVYSDDDCGRAALDFLSKSADEKGYCLGKSRMMAMTAKLEDAVEIVKELDENEFGKVVVMLTNEDDSLLLLEAVRVLNLVKRFIFIGVDTMTRNHHIPATLSEVALGSVMLKLHRAPVPGFARWVSNITDTNRHGLPEDWFHEFWQHMHKCHIRNAAVVVDKYARPCTMSEQLDVDMIDQHDDALYTIASTLFVAKGLSLAASSATCQGQELDDCLKANQQMSMEIADFMKSGGLTVLPDELGTASFVIKLSDHNDAETNYVIYNYQKVPNENPQFVKVGECVQSSCQMTNPVYGYNDQGQPVSSFSSECPKDEISCVCERRDEPIKYRDPPGIADQFTEVFGIIIIILNLIGMLLSFILFFHFLCFYPNRGGTTVLGYIALFGVFILFAFNFAYVFYPHPIVCGVRRFCQGVIYAIIFGALAVKCMCTWKNTNIHDDFQIASRKRYTHPVGLVIISMCFVLVQVMIVTLWLILEPPLSENIIYHGQYWPRCTPHDFYNQGLVLSLLYVMFLMALTLGFSGFSWPSTESNFEARYILGSTVFVMGTWMVWCIVSTMTEVKYRDGATAIGNIFCGYGIVFFVYFRKCFLLHKFRRQKYSRKLGDDGKSKSEGIYDNIAHEKDDDQMSDRSSGHGSLGSNKD